MRQRLRKRTTRRRRERDPNRRLLPPRNAQRFNRQCRDCRRMATVARRDLIRAAPPRCAACGGILDRIDHAPTADSKWKRAQCQGCGHKFKVFDQDLLNGITCQLCGGVLKAIWSHKPGPRRPKKEKRQRDMARDRAYHAAHCGAGVGAPC